MTQHIDTIVIGGGQSGLAASYYLQQRGIDHIVLEAAAQPANAWRNDRWDLLTLVTPNWSFRMPGAEYQAADPHGFMPRSEIVRTFERYIERFQLPVYYRQKVTSLEPLADGAGYLINTLEMRLQARQVVIASGMFARPLLPAFSREFRHPSPRSIPASTAIRALCGLGRYWWWAAASRHCILLRSSTRAAGRST